MKVKKQYIKFCEHELPSQIRLQESQQWGNSNS